MNKHNFSEVEKNFHHQQEKPGSRAHTPYIIVENFPELGLLIALRFLEWVSANPDGVISLPTGKTPEYFIKWVQHLLKHWDDEQGKGIRMKYGLGKIRKPVMTGLHFVQIDEFYPIDPN